MRVLSAAEAIQPAIDRTRALLTQRRSLPTFFKITLIATLAALGNSFNFRFGNFTGQHGGHTTIPPQMMPFIAALAAFGVLLAIVFGVIALVLLYVGNRCEFVLFDMVLMRRTEAGPAWRLFAARTWRWLGAKLAILLAFTLLLGLLSLPMVLSFMRASREHRHITMHSALSLFGGIWGSLLGLFALFVVFYVVFTLMHDFLLPAIALEDAPVFASFGRLGSLVAAEPGQIAVYLLLRVLLGIVLGVVMAMAVATVAIIVGLLLAAVGGVLFVLLHHAGVGGMVVLGVAVALEVLVLIAVVLLTYIAAAGSVMVFFQAWSLYFLGGRYTLLGDLLEPPAAYVAAPAASHIAAPYTAPTEPPPFVPPAAL